jgi:serine/threonine-protein kinase
MMAGPAGPPVATPTPPRRRRRGLIAGAISGVVVLVAAVVAVVVWPEDTSSTAASPSPTPASAAPSPSAAGAFADNVAGPQLRSILLTSNDIPGGLTLESDAADLLSDAGAVTPADCLGAWAPAQRSTYSGTGATAVAAQSLRGMNATAWQEGVVQAAVAFTDQQKAGIFLVGQRGQWAVCGGQAVNVTPPGGSPQTWTFGSSVTTNGVVIVEARLPGGTSCQRGMQVRGNVILDIRQCNSGGGNNVVALVNAMAAKVPRQ